MFKDFSNFNEEQTKVLQPKSVLALSDAIRTQSTLLSMLQNVVSRYTRAYNSVQVIKYDENGDPVDVTPDEQLTVPENVLAFARASIDQVRNQLSEYRDVVSDLTSTIAVTSQQWQRDLESNIVCLGGHAISISDLVQGRNIPETSLMIGANIESGSIFPEVSQYASFLSTLPDAAVENDGDWAYCWVNGNVAFVNTSMSITTIDGDDIYFGFFYNGKFYAYDFTSSMSGRYRGMVNAPITISAQGVFDFIGFSGRPILSTLTISARPYAYAVTGQNKNLHTTSIAPTVSEAYEVETPAILLDSIITTDQNLLDVKAAL